MVKKSANAIFSFAFILIVVDTVWLMYNVRKRRYITNDVLLYSGLIMLIALSILIVAWTMKQSENYYDPSGIQKQFAPALVGGRGPIPGGAVYVNGSGDPATCNYCVGLGWLP